MFVLILYRPYPYEPIIKGKNFLSDIYIYCPGRKLELLCTYPSWTDPMQWAHVLENESSSHQLKGGLCLNYNELLFSPLF